MARGVTSLRKIQMGWEPTPGTGVAATFLWRGTSSGISDDRTIKQVEEQVGILSGTDRTVETQRLSTLALDETPFTFEQFPVLLATSLGGPKTGVQDGTGSDYLYTTTIAEAALPTIQTLTVEAGNNAEEKEMEFAHCPEWKVIGAHGEEVRMSATLRGQVVAASTFTGALTPYAVREAITSYGKLYIDAIGGTYGGTIVSNAILAFEINCKAMLIPKFTMDGTLDFSVLCYTGHEITGSITYESDTAVSLASGAHSFYAAQTPKKLQIKLEGPAFTTPGTTYSVYTTIFNLPIKFSKISVLESMDGNDTVKAEFFSKYNLTAADSGEIIVVNEKTAL